MIYQLLVKVCSDLPPGKLHHLKPEIFRSFGTVDSRSSRLARDGKRSSKAVVPTLSNKATLIAASPGIMPNAPASQGPVRDSRPAISSTSGEENRVYCLSQHQVSIQRRVLAGVAHVNHELAGIDGPLLRGLIPVAEGARIEVQGYVLRLSGGEANLREALQFAFGTIELGGGIGDVELGNLGAFDAAGVGDVEADRNRGAGDGVVIRRSGAVFPTAIEGDGEPALWVVLAEEDLGDGQVRMLAGWIVYPKFGRGLSDYAQ